jgi:putative nucleotidyltransferase with HDIG domain
VNRRVRRLILITVAVAVLAIAAASVLYPIRPEIGGLPGLAFWTLAMLLASALPVRLPRGTFVSVAAAPMIAVFVLGGPLAAALVSFVGTTEAREIRGKVPWYGTVFNHASAVVVVILAGSAFEVLRAWFPADPLLGSIASLLATLVASGVYFGTSWLLALGAVSARTSVPIRTVWAQDVGGVAATLVGLAPVAWLMSQTFQLPNGVGWWATALFVVPLFTTRLAYARYVETRDLFEQTITALSKAVDARDRYTRDHSYRVSHITEAMCRAMRLAEGEIEKIKWAGLLHDVGKIGIRDNILLKEGPLDKHERVRMNQHPVIGEDIVRQASQLKAEAPLIRAHHEWFNGSGYPDGREALDIPLGARILSVADAYEAMTSPRPYRKTALTHEQAVEQLEKFSGIQFDPEIVPVLLALDRRILDRPPDDEDELPTMLHEPDPRDQPGTTADTAAATAYEPEVKSRPALASDDVS